MKQIISRYIKKFGYTPSIYELHSLYTQGLLSLSDKEENILPIDEEGYCECVQELIEDLIYDVDGIKIKNIKVIEYE